MGPSAPVLLCALGLLLCAAGCGGASEATGAAPARTAPSDAVATVETVAAAPPAGPVERGADANGVVRLKASRPAVTLHVRLVEVVDPAPPTAVFSPQRENRFVAAHLEIRNDSGVTYTDTASTGADVVDTTGADHPAAVVHAVEPGLRRVTVGPGETVSGFVTFELPKDARLSQLRIRLNSGFGPEIGVWALP